MATASAVLEARDLTREFTLPNKKTLRAVDGVSLALKPGVCFGLLGPNGAGKTTTIEILEGIQHPLSGEIVFQGKRVPAELSYREYAAEIGIQFQSTSLQERLTVEETLDLFSSFYERLLPRQELIQWCDLSELLERDVNHLSGGQRQRVLLALALLNDPALVFLDEPTTGLDPGARRGFWELIRQVQSRGKTVLLTTHYMDEAYELCDEIAIMDRGKIIAQGAPDALLSKHFQGGSIRLPSSVGDLRGKGIAGSVFALGDSWEIQTERIEETLRGLLNSGVPMDGIQVRQKNLEDLFIELTGRGFTEGAAAEGGAQA
jgi:ABC-2 type transport system ATP-binding protein